jgi:NitT/TauT family transport system permease protein
MAGEQVGRLLGHLGGVGLALGVWEYAAQSGWLDPTFFGRPSGIARYLWRNLLTSPALLHDLAWTVAGTLCAFGLGSAAAVLVGLLFAAAPRLERVLEPYLSTLNAMPRIALAPLFILWFGLGIGSKIAVGASLTFFIVLSSTVAGIRSVNPDHATLCRTLGATPTQRFVLVTMPGAVPVVFSGLRLGLIYALLGVIAAEFIAAEHGVGQTLAYLGATFNMNGVMGVLVVLALLATAVTRGLSALERRLLHWQ